MPVTTSLFPEQTPLVVGGRYSAKAPVTLAHGDCLDLLRSIPTASAQLVITSPPYNIGKSYEKRCSLADYVAQQKQVIEECVRITADAGSICWQVGNYVEHGAIIPLDIALYSTFADLGCKLRNRIVWHFEHGLHCSRRFSGRYETVMWFTKADQYVFNLDPVRVPQKYPGKRHFKGPRAGELSCNPLGKNPGDVWVIPNVKHNHVEKTTHPCQFPVELVERFVLSLTNEQDLVVDPYMGVGSTAVAAVLHQRRAAGAETVREYHDTAMDRVRQAAAGVLPTRPRDRAVYVPLDTKKRGRATNEQTTSDTKAKPRNGVHRPTLWEAE